jgi:carotenoid 1,2-hydratase
VGSVFSPYYAWARGRAGDGTADPEQHCAINVALYGDGPNLWTMTERRSGAIDRGPDHFTIGPSALRWDGATLTIEIDEVAVPLPRRVRGRVRVTPRALTNEEFAIDHQNRHRWWPIAPTSDVSVAFDTPALNWSGTGYHDRNRGDEPLEAGFQEWDWSRAPLSDGGTAVLYDTFRRDGTDHALALRIAGDGSVTKVQPPPLSDLRRTAVWRIRRRSRADAGHVARIARTLEDTPFYARSLIDTHILGEDVRAMHESLSLDRFRLPVVRLMLPFRMPRTLR